MPTMPTTNVQNSKTFNSLCQTKKSSNFHICEIFFKNYFNDFFRLTNTSIDLHSMLYLSWLILVVLDTIIGKIQFSPNLECQILYAGLMRMMLWAQNCRSLKNHFRICDCWATFIGQNRVHLKTWYPVISYQWLEHARAQTSSQIIEWLTEGKLSVISF